MAAAGPAIKIAIKKNDNVVVLAGKSRGRTGRVLRILHGEGRAIVEGVNFIKRHTKPNPQRQIKGGVVEREASLHASNVQMVCPECDRPTRLGPAASNGVAAATEVIASPEE